MSIQHIYDLGKGIKSKRISSYDRSGGNHDYVKIPGGETFTLADISGRGIIKHIWMTLDCPDPMIRRNAVLRMYWNQETEPSVDVPLGDFFGQGWGENYNYHSLPLASTPLDGRGLVCYFPMPFEDGARLELLNQSKDDIASFYYYIDYESHTMPLESAGTFHAEWRRQLTRPQTEAGETEWGVVGPPANNATAQNNFVFASIKGRGKVVGIQYFVDNPSPIWFGEGDDMWLIDGEEWPGSLHGTGTEDFFNTAWCPNEVYLHPYFGIAKVPNNSTWLGRSHYYRFFIEDPIYFDKSLVASIEHGHANNLTLDLCTVVYWYQAEPHSPLARLPEVEERRNQAAIDLRDIHVWRHHYRQSQGDGFVWGNEGISVQEGEHHE